MPAVITPIKKEVAAPQMPPPSKGIKHRLVETIVAVACVILILEGLFAMSGVGEQEFLRVDHTLGFVPMEGKHVTWRKEGFGSIQFNSQGRNDIERPFAKPANTYRIGVLGDSFVESLQVDRSQNFCTLLEQNLNAKYGSKRHIEVLNFGCSANNLGQFYKKLNGQVFRYQPDLVLVGISVDATKLLAPVQGGFAFANARPTFLLDKQGKLVEDWQIFNWWNHSPDGRRFANTGFLRQYSHIWGAIGTMMGSYSIWSEELRAGKVWGWGQAQTPAVALVKKELPKPGDFSAINSSCGGSTGNGSKVSASGALSKPLAGPLSGPVVASASPSAPAPAPTPTKVSIALPQAQGDVAAATKQYWPVADKLIRAMDLDCKQHHCIFAVAHLPARPEIGFDNPTETKNLDNLTRSLGIPYIDLTSAFLNAPKETSLIYTVHMTPAGHRLACRQFLDFFERNKLVGN
jgi:hypothetical protein